MPSALQEGEHFINQNVLQFVFPMTIMFNRFLNHGQQYPSSDSLSQQNKISRNVRILFFEANYSMVPVIPASHFHIILTTLLELHPLNIYLNPEGMK